MAESLNRKNLELSVTNLGPIAKAEIDLRPMTVFVGPSNTGKSYLAILLYALHGFFGGSRIGSEFRRFNFFSSTRDFHHRPPLSQEDVKEFGNWMKKVSSRVHTQDSPKDCVATLPESIAKLVRPMLTDVGEFGHALDREVANSFGVEDTLSLVRNRVRSGASVVARRPAGNTDETSESIEYRFDIKGRRRDLVPSIPDTVPLHFAMNYGNPFRGLPMDEFPFLISQLRGGEDDNRDMYRFLSGSLVESVGAHIVRPLSRAAHYLPADRTGVMHAHRTVVRSIIGQASRAGFQRDTPLPQLSGVLADFLNQLIGLGDMPEGNLDRSLARNIEIDILQGKVRMENSLVGYPEFFYRPAGWERDLRLMNTSSMVSELAPVVLYLRHVVRPGEVLIIEEPESHMHPAMQVEFIRHLAAAVRAGARIMITTHSEWVLDALANLVHLSDLPKSRREGIPGGDFALRAGDVGVWLFEPKKSPKGSVVREIPFSADYGGYASDFNEVAKGTYNDWARVANLIEEAGKR